jgi:hypothetical protein
MFVIGPVPEAHIRLHVSGAHRGVDNPAGERVGQLVGWPEKFSTTAAVELGRGVSCRYKMSAPCTFVPYLPGRGRRGIKKPRGLDQWPALHLAGALVYHLPKWESGRHNLW